MFGGPFPHYEGQTRRTGVLLENVQECEFRYLYVVDVCVHTAHAGGFGNEVVVVPGRHRSRHARNVAPPAMRKVPG